MLPNDTYEEELQDVRDIIKQRSKRISLSKNHIYTVDEDTNKVKSVTRWKASHYEGFDSDKIIDNMMKSHRWEYSKYFGMTKTEIKKLWKDNGNEASRLGTLLHADIEDFYNGEEVDNDSVEYQYFMDFEKERWRRLIPFEAELIIFDEDIGIAGTVDMIFYENTDDGIEFHVYDWKRSKYPIEFTSNYGNYMTTKCIKHIPKTNYYEYCLQLNMYTYILREKYGMNVATMNIVILHEDHENYIHQDIEYLDEMSSLISNIKHKKDVINRWRFPITCCSY